MPADSAMDMDRWPTDVLLELEAIRHALIYACRAAMFESTCIQNSTA